MMIREKITDAIKRASGLEKVNLECPENEAFGDYSSNVALQGKNPKKDAERIIEKLKKDGKLSGIIERVEIAGSGFINFWLKKDVLIDGLKQIDMAKSDFGKSDEGKGKTVIIDYSSPNIAKPFGIGHLRSTIIGQALYNLYKSLGYEVVGDNHLGDWGTQFGKLICMIETENPEELSIENLEKLYVEFHKKAEDNPELEEKARECFKKLEAGDPETKAIWQKCVDISLKEFAKVYDLLGVKTDFAFGESYYESEMRSMVGDSGIRRHLITGEEGAMVIDLSQYGIKTPLMFLKKDGATTYATRDLATIKFRTRKWDPDIIIYEVGVEQNLHFRQVFAAARLLKLVKPEVLLVHTAHGLYLAPEGQKFSTRKGNTVKLEDVLNEAEARAEKLALKSGEAKNKDEIDKLRKSVGIGAVKYFDLMHATGSNVVFDWDKMMNLEGNSGPYLQYTAARANSVIAKAKGKDQKFEAINNPNEEELSILRSLIKFPEIIKDSADRYAPNLLCNYLYSLAQKFNGFYGKHKIIDSENEEFRLALAFGVMQVLKNGLKILGIETPERM